MVVQRHLQIAPAVTMPQPQTVKVTKALNDFEPVVRGVSTVKLIRLSIGLATHEGS